MSRFPLRFRGVKQSHLTADLADVRASATAEPRAKTTAGTRSRTSRTTRSSAVSSARSAAARRPRGYGAAARKRSGNPPGGGEDERRKERLASALRDMRDMAAKHPEAQMPALLGDGQFLRFCGSRLGREPLCELYESRGAFVKSVILIFIEK